MHYPYKWSSAPLETASHCLGTQASWPVSFRDSFVSTSLGLGYLHAWHFKKKNGFWELNRGLPTTLSPQPPNLSNRTTHMISFYLTIHVKGQYQVQPHSEVQGIKICAYDIQEYTMQSSPQYINFLVCFLKQAWNLCWWELYVLDKATLELRVQFASAFIVVLGLKQCQAGPVVHGFLKAAQPFHMNRGYQLLLYLQLLHKVPTIYSKLLVFSAL